MFFKSNVNVILLPAQASAVCNFAILQSQFIHITVYYNILLISLTQSDIATYQVPATHYPLHRGLQISLFYQLVVCL